MEYDALKLDNQLCFPIYVASREIIQAYGPYLSQLDITYPQYLVLMVLWQQDQMTINSIGKLLHLDSGTLTPLLKRMQSKGLITRSRCTEDERAVRIALTPRGSALRERAVSIPTELSQSTNLSPEEIETLKRLLRKLIND